MLFETKIIKQFEVAKGTHEATFERPSAFVFKAGQYVQIAVPKLTHSDPKGASRLFSVASSPQDFENLSVVFRVSGSGFKETLRVLPIGSTVTLEQASGNFILPQTLTQPHVFIAGGVGIAPFMSSLFKNVKNDWKQPVTLIYGNRNPESAAYLHELRLMAVQRKQFSLEEIYKKPTADFFAKVARVYTNAVWWVVGPPAMVALTVSGLQAGGISVENIRTEPFDGY